MANEFKKMGLTGKDKLIIDLLEDILEELRLIRKAAGTTPSPS